MKEALSSSETSVLTRATRRNNPEVTILHSHRRENLKSYIVLQLVHFLAHVNIVLMFVGIEEVFLSTAMGLIRLSRDSVCPNLRIHDVNEPMSPVSNVGSQPFLEGDRNGGGQSEQPLQMTSVAHAEVERTRMCC
jgi:hypothetical protein